MLDSKVKDELFQLLDDLEEYMDDKADADGDSEGMHHNKEMQFLVEIEQIRQKILKNKADIILW
jgi:ElaB/YqjD/DUF883 family membrane-anchored ribosome-binding protein